MPRERTKAKNPVEVGGWPGRKGDVRLWDNLSKRTWPDSLKRTWDRFLGNLRRVPSKLGGFPGSWWIL